MATAVEATIPPQLRAPNGDGLYEVVDGEVREVSGMGSVATVIASVLQYYMNAHAIPSGLGLAVTELLFRLPNTAGRERRPDVAFVTTPRLPDPLYPPGEDPPTWNLAPDLAVELVSPTNSAPDIDAKVLEYFVAGCAQVWLVYPLTRRVYVYDSPTQVRILTIADTLDGGAFLPGFSLPAAALFTPPVRPA